MTGQPSFDAVVVGAGPAGMAAATELAARGASVLMVDRQASPGGQIYRGAVEPGHDAERLFGKSYMRGPALIAAFGRQSIETRWNASAVGVRDGFEVDVASPDRLERIACRILILATGAYERPLAIPGWTMPGVMTAGAAQLMAKQSRLVPSEPFVIAGAGPLIWLLAWQYAQMGARPEALVSLGDSKALRRALPHAFSFLGSDYAADAVKYLRTAYRSTRVVRARRLVRIEGDGRPTALIAETRTGRSVSIPARRVFLHNGVLPDANMTNALGCRLEWDEIRHSWQPATDAWQRGDRDGLYVAGDGAGVDGAIAAEFSGRIAASDALVRLGRISQAERDTTAAPWIAERGRHLSGRPFIDTLFAPIEPSDDPDVPICRCENVSASRAADVIDDARGVGVPPGALVSHLKAISRCGMGPCQARMCGPSLARFLDTRYGVSAADAGKPSQRYPAAPMQLASLADLPLDGEAAP